MRLFAVFNKVVFNYYPHHTTTYTLGCKSKATSPTSHIKMISEFIFLHQTSLL